ncbi:MAG: threonine--tRNA ligase [Synergistaceae bacterium]|nr:threonine--tRNA ligase [Synergistaceae bacterium]
MFVFSSNNKNIEIESGSYADVIRQLGQLKVAIAAEVDGEHYDLSAPINKGGEISAVTCESEIGLEIIRHSAAHLMAQAIENIWSGAKFGVGPCIKDGFYYDVELPEGVVLNDEDLPKIEAEMKRLAKESIPVARKELSYDDAIAFFEGKKDPYKVELINDIRSAADDKDGKVSLYFQGNYSDLCRGPHVPDTSWIKHFKLLSVAGAYWRGKSENIMLTRVYGTAFADSQSLSAHLKRMEEARARDHRKLGRELDLFSLNEEGPGFPFFHPKGMMILNKLTDFWRREHRKRGYSEIRTPLILDRGLWIRSGHWDHYKDNMYFTEIDERPFAVKPMNCPGGIIVYKSRMRSYRDLPLRMAELGIVHRHELSGVLYGLMRVRCFTQDDAHLYCRPEQIKDEVIGIMDLCEYIYKTVFGFDYHVELSTRPENCMGSAEQWEIAENSLKEALDAAGTQYKLNPGDGAFYGPKIDFHLEDCIGRTWQCGTIQLDFQMPERFDLHYISNDGKEHRPVMLHRTVLGSLERFFGILIENFAGAFPFWIAPVQAKILTISEDYMAWANDVEAELKEWGINAEIDGRAEKLGKKVRDAQVEKIPYMLVIGEKEAATGSVSVRERSDGDLGSMTMDELKGLFDKEFDPTK